MTNNKTLALIKPAIILTVICVIAALLLAVVNYFTAPKIEVIEQQKLKNSFSAVLPGAEGFEELSAKNAPKSIKKICKETSGKGYALLLNAQSGYHTLEFTMGIDNDGKITGISMISPIHSGGNTKFKNTLPDFLNSYKGVGKDLEGSTDKVSGATKSSIAMRTAMDEAFNYVESLKEGA